MKAVILAGGTGTRLKPLTFWTNKHLLPVGTYPMICHGVAKLREAGYRDLLIVTSRSAIGSFADILGSGRDWGVSLTYRIQEEAGGIAQALELAKQFITPREKFAVLLGDNLFEESLTGYREQFERQKTGAMVVLKKVQDACRIDEKPEYVSRDYCVTGLYFYDYEVFDMMDRIRSSHRGEMEITDVNNAYAEAGKLGYAEVHGWWTDAGTFESLLDASKRLKGALP